MINENTDNMNSLDNQSTVTQYVDQLGNPIDPSLINENGEYINPTQPTAQYVDEYGNPIDPSLIDENGNYIGVQEQPQYVDEYGNPIDPSLIDENGNYISGEQPQYVDEYGNPIDPSLIDENGNYIGNEISEQGLAQELNDASGNTPVPGEAAAVAAAKRKEKLTGMVTFDYNNVPITDIVNSIILDSINKGASDIHFDPFDEGIKIRLRIDGELNDYSIVPLYVKRNMITRIKIISGMNITESRVPQDGAIRTELQNKTIDLRVSCLPTNVGEKIVIRIMDYSMSAQGIDALDFSETNLEKVKRMLELPNGIILVTGATGSGKSTTVYSMLQRLNTEDTNLITVEDPIEMNIGGINQVQAQSEIGLTFAAVLRSILRQDPDVIMIGEIRDDETARIAVRAAITGHLVLSTIHTNNALNTIERLTDMSVERYLLGSSLSGIISQKLARRLCDECKRLRPTTDYERSIIKTALEKDVDEIYEPVGCPYCSRGYRGRVAVHEVLLLNQKIRDAITKGEDKADLRAKVYSHHGADTMLEDGLKKVLEGKTSFEEVLKLIDLEDDLGSGTQLGLVDQMEASTYNNDDENTNLLKTPELSGPTTPSPDIPEGSGIKKAGPPAPPMEITNNQSPATTQQLSGPINLNIPPELVTSLEGLTSLKDIVEGLAKVAISNSKVEDYDIEDDDNEEIEQHIIRKRKKKKPKKVIIEEIIEDEEEKDIDDETETIIKKVPSKKQNVIDTEETDEITYKQPIINIINPVISSNEPVTSDINNNINEDDEDNIIEEKIPNNENIEISDEIDDITEKIEDTTTISQDDNIEEDIEISSDDNPLYDDENEDTTITSQDDNIEEDIEISSDNNPLYDDEIEDTTITSQDDNIEEDIEISSDNDPLSDEAELFDEEPHNEDIDINIKSISQTDLQELESDIVQEDIENEFKDEDILEDIDIDIETELEDIDEEITENSYESYFTNIEDNKTNDQSLVVQKALEEMKNLNNQHDYNNEPIFIDLSDVDYLESIIQTIPIEEEHIIDINDDNLDYLNNVNTITEDDYEIFEDNESNNIITHDISDIIDYDIINIEQEPSYEDIDYFDIEDNLPNDMELYQLSKEEISEIEDNIMTNMENFKLSDKEIDEVLDILGEE